MPSVDISQIEHVGVLQAMVMEKNEQIRELVDALRAVVDRDFAYMFEDARTNTPGSLYEAVRKARGILYKHEAAHG
jgi:hypothetical protein